MVTIYTHTRTFSLRLSDTLGKDNRTAEVDAVHVYVQHSTYTDCTSFFLTLSGELVNVASQNTEREK